MATSLNEIYNLKQSIAFKLVVTLLVMSVIILPLSIFNWNNHGFHLNYVVHILTIIAAGVLLQRNDKYSYKPEFIVSISILTVIAGLGIYSLGFNSGTIALLIAGTTLTFICFSSKTTIIYFAATLASFILLTFLRGNISSFETINQNDFANSVNLFTYLSIILFSSILCLLLFEHRKRLQNALFLIEKQNQEVKYLSNHDYLTGLSSPRLAQEQLELTLSMSKRHNFKTAILYIDINDFKVINDALGHDAGDHALKVVAKRLQDIIRDTDIACRQGGDEFLVILHYPVSTDACEIICKRLLSAFDSRITYEDHEIKINLSIGVAIFPDHGTTQFDLRSSAAKAMQYSKENHKHNYTFAETI